MEFDTGAAAWMLMSASLVLLMTPGLAFFYGGMARAKAALNMVLMSFVSIGMVGVVWVLWGYGMTSAPGVLGGLVGDPFADLGLVPEAASSLLLPARVGHLRAFAMLALGEVVPAARAVDWGLASTVVPASELLATALSLARAVADRAPGAMATTKALLRDVGALTARLDVEGAAFVERLRSPEARAAFERFLGHAG